MAELINAVGDILRRGGPTETNVFPSAGSLLVEGTDRSEGIWDGSGASLTLAGGAGDDRYHIWNTNRQVIEYPGQGIDTVDTWMSFTLPENVENLRVTGDQRYAWGNSLDNIVSGASGQQTLNGFAGNDILEGRSGRDIFIVAEGNGSDLIADFEAGATGDIVRLEYPGLGGFDSVRSRIVQEGADAVLRFDNGEKLVFRGVSRDAFVAENFQLPVDLSGRELVFADEFSGETGFTDRWKFTYYWGEHFLSDSEELQFYVDPRESWHGVDAHRIGDGTLRLVAEPMKSAVRPSLGYQDYTSGMISSEPSFSMQYGYFEMRAKLPEGKGLWPAFWLLPADGSWPPELDVMEMLGDQPDILFSTIHTKQSGSHSQTSKAIPVDDMTDGFHTYGVDWQRDTITYYFDGVAVWEVPTPADMHEPMYVIANLAVGGIWPGSPNGSTAFPAEMVIDYIRAYEPAAERDAVPVPRTWAAIDPATAFPDIAVTDVPRTWDFRTTMAAGEVALELVGEWARYVTGNSLGNVIIGSEAPYGEIDGGKGDDVLTGSGGADVFVLRDGHGNDRITDFSNEPGNADKVRLVGFHFAHFDDVRPWLVETADGVMLRLDQDQAVFFDGLRIAELSPEQFVFVDPEAPPAQPPAPDLSSAAGIPGLNLWLDMAAEGTEGALHRVTDRSGRGGDAVAAAGTATVAGSGGPLVFDGSDLFVIETTAGLNLGGPFTGKTLTFAIEAGADVTSRQVLYEQGGTARGISIVVEGGEVIMTAWNLREATWGPKSVRTEIAPGERTVLSLVFDADARAMSSVKDGEVVDTATGVGLLYDHGDPIGLGGVANGSLGAAGEILRGGPSWSGKLYETAAWDRALSASELADLHEHLAYKWADGAVVAKPAPVAETLPPEAADDIVLWLDAGELSAGPAGFLADLSGSGNHARQADAARQATAADGLLAFDGGDVYAIDDTEDINLRDTYSGKTITAALVLGEDVSSRQVIFEEGGGVRGLSIYVEAGELVMTGWNLRESSWGPVSVRTRVEAGEAVVVSLVHDAVAGTLTGLRDGVVFGVAEGVGELRRHGADIGLGGVVDGAIDDAGRRFADGDGYEGGLLGFAYHDAAVPHDVVAGLHGHLAEDWADWLI